MRKNEKIATALTIARNIIRAMEEEQMQELMHLNNPRCKKPNFAYLEYSIGRFAEYVGEPAPTSDEVEKLVRSIW